MSRIRDALRRAEENRAARAIPTGPAKGVERNTAGADQVGGSPPADAASRSMADLFASGGSHSPAQLRKLLPELCRQCAWKPNPKTMLFFDGRKPVAGAEEFRTLRSHLSLIHSRQPLQKLLITSPLPLEGKTFTATNLAHVIAQQQDQRVLLIDSDLRLSRVHRMLGAPSAPGLSDYLHGLVDEFSIIQRSSSGSFFFIPGGKPASQPSELIVNGRMKLLLHRLSPAFDWIILDSPAVISVSDAKLLAELCDGVLVVVRAGATPFDLAQKACQEFQSKHLVGVVLNRADPGEVYSSHYYGMGSGARENNGKERQNGFEKG